MANIEFSSLKKVFDDGTVAVEDFERYLAEKRRLAARRWEHVQDYADAKAVVVEEIVTRAGGASRR